MNDLNNVETHTTSRRISDQLNKTIELENRQIEEIYIENIIMSSQLIRLKPFKIIETTNCILDLGKIEEDWVIRRSDIRALIKNYRRKL